MKKILSAALAALMLVTVFSACNSGTPTSSSAASSSSSDISSSTSDESAVSSSDVSSSSEASSESVASSSSAVSSSSAPASSSSKPASSSSSKPASSSSGGFVLGNNAWSTTFANPMDAWPGVDISKPVTLIWYMFNGAVPTDFPMVLDKINENLQKDINAKLTINFLTTGASFATQYQLRLAAQTQADMWQQNPNTQYQNSVRQGAYKALSTDMIKKYMPRKWAYFPQDQWKRVKVLVGNTNDIYMIPTSTPNKQVFTIVFRDDIAAKYGLTTPTRLADAGPLFAAVKANETVMKPMKLNQADLANIFNQSAGIPSDEMNQQITPGMIPQIISISAYDGSVHDKRTGPEMDTLKANANVMKSWYDAGYVNKDYASTSVSSRQAWEAGSSLLMRENSINIQQSMVIAKNNGWPVKLIPILDKQGHTAITPYGTAGMSVAANSKNPERSLMALDLIMEDVHYNLLAYYGIEGYHYTIDSNGYLNIPPNLVANNARYKADAAGFWWTNKDQFPQQAVWPQTYIDYKHKYIDTPGTLTNNVMDGFQLDTANVKGEVANMTAVRDQYWYPIQAGAVANVDEAINQLIDQLNKAGFNKVLAEVQRQAPIYLASN